MAWFDEFNLPGATIDGYFGFIRADGPDDDDYPDVALANGWVTFKATTPAARVDGAWLGIEEVRAQIFEGQIVISEEDSRPVRLLATDAPIGVADWAWTAKFDLDGFSLAPLTFRAPRDTTVNLTADLIPIKSQPYQIIEGASIVDAEVSGEGTMRFALSDGSFTSWMDVPNGERGLPGAPGEKGDRGDDGAAATLAMGSVTAGTTADAWMTGTPLARELHLTLPRGQKGDKGDPGTKGDPGDPATPVSATASAVSGEALGVDLSFEGGALDFEFTLPPAGPHTHHRLDNAAGYLTLDSAGGLQHGAGGSRKFWVDDQGVMRQGFVPYERVTGAPVTPTAGGLKVAPLALTTGQTVFDYNTSRSVRVPLRFNASLGRWRLHIRSWNPRLGTVVTGGHDFTGLWLASTTGAGVITGTPTQLRGAFSTPTDGAEWVSAWQTADIGGDVERLLCFGYTGTAQPPGLTGGSYQNADPAQAITGAAHSRATVTPFDLWIEAETPATTAIIAGVGDSLTSGTGATLPVYDSWVSQYARRVGGLPLHMSHHGDSMRGFLTVNPDKVGRWSHLARADAVVWALGSNDISDGRTQAQMETDFAALLPIIEANVGPVRYAATVQPRNSWDAATEARRATWNAWLRARPGVRATFDFAAAVSTDGDTLRPEYDSGDGAHLNTAGYTAEQALITTSITAPVPATAAQVQGVAARVSSLETGSGLRDVTALLGFTGGKAYLLVKSGWCDLTLINATVSGTGNVQLTASGLVSVAPIAPMDEKSTPVLAGSTGATRRLTITRLGSASVYGIATGDVLNGSLSWPMTRTNPALWPGTAV